MLPLATPLACSRMAEVVAEVAAVVDELVAAVSNGQQHSSAEVNDDSSSPTEDEDSDNAEADALVAGEAASNEDGAAAGAAAKTPQPAVSDALPTSVKKAIEAHEARATWVDSACEGADELMPLPWRGTDNVYVKLARKIEPRDKAAVPFGRRAHAQLDPLPDGRNVWKGSAISSAVTTGAVLAVAIGTGAAFRFWFVVRFVVREPTESAVPVKAGNPIVAECLGLIVVLHWMLASLDTFSRLVDRNSVLAENARAADALYDEYAPARPFLR